MDNMEKLYSLTVGDIRKLLADWEADAILDDIIDLLDIDNYLNEDEDSDEDYDDESYYDDDEDEDYDYDGDSSYYDDNYDDDDDWYEDDEDEDEIEEGHSLDTPINDEIAESIARDIRNGEYSLSTIRYLYAPEVIARIQELI